MTVPCDTGSSREELEKDPEFEGRECFIIHFVGPFATTVTDAIFLPLTVDFSPLVRSMMKTFRIHLLNVPADTCTFVQTDDWTSKKGKYAANISSLQARARYVRNFLRSRPEKCIVLVAHGDILRYIVFGEQNGTPWSNAEVRKYTFVEEDDEDAWLKLIETEAKEGREEPTSSSKTTNGQL